MNYEEDDEVLVDNAGFYDDENGDDEYDGDEKEIVEEDTWNIVSAYFEEKGLVSQQLNSFNDFVENTMQVR